MLSYFDISPDDQRPRDVEMLIQAAVQLDKAPFVDAWFSELCRPQVVLETKTPVILREQEGE